MSDYWRDLPIGPRPDDTEPPVQMDSSQEWVIELQRDGRWAYWWPTKDDQFGPFPRSYAASAAKAREGIAAFWKDADL